VFQCAVGGDNIFFLLLILVFSQCKVFSVLLRTTLFCLSHEAVCVFILSVSKILIHCQEWRKDCKIPLLVLVYTEKKDIFYTEWWSACRRLLITAGWESVLSCLSQGCWLYRGNLPMPISILWLYSCGMTYSV